MVSLTASGLTPAAGVVVVLDVNGTAGMVRTARSSGLLDFKIDFFLGERFSSTGEFSLFCTSLSSASSLLSSLSSLTMGIRPSSLSPSLLLLLLLSNEVEGFSFGPILPSSVERNKSDDDEWESSVLVVTNV